MMTRCLGLVLAGVFLVSLVSVLLPEPAQAVCRPYCLDLHKKGGEARDFDRGERGEKGKRHHYGWAKHELHKKHKHGSHRGHGGHADPPVTQPPVTPPPVTPPPVEPTPCIGC